MAPGSVGQKLAAVATALGSTIQSVAPSPDGKTLLLGLAGAGALAGVHYRLVDLQSQKVVWDIGGLPTTRHLAAWRPDGGSVVVTGGDARLVALDPQDGAVAALVLPGGETHGA